MFLNLFKFILLSDLMIKQVYLLSLCIVFTCARNQLIIRSFRYFSIIFYIQPLIWTVCSDGLFSLSYTASFQPAIQSFIQHLVLSIYFKPISLVFFIMFQLWQLSNGYVCLQDHRLDCLKQLLNFYSYFSPFTLCIVFWFIVVSDFFLQYRCNVL